MLDFYKKSDVIRNFGAEISSFKILFFQKKYNNKTYIKKSTFATFAAVMKIRYAETPSKLPGDQKKETKNSQ